MKSRLIILITILLLVYGCEKKTTAPNETAEIELSDAEQMEVVAAEIAADNGGVMAHVAMATDISRSGSGNLTKPVSYDTTFTRGWITYSLSLAFYTAQVWNKTGTFPSLLIKSCITVHYPASIPLKIPGRKLA